MKNKTNKKPRKIKNYLSSLCKWAKNNTKKIIAFIGCLFLMLGMCCSSCKSSKTAEASGSNVQVSNMPLLFLPSVEYPISDGSITCYSTPLFLATSQYGLRLFVQSGGTDIHYIQVYPTVIDNQTLTFSSRPHFFSSSDFSTYKYFNLGSYPNDKYIIQGYNMDLFEFETLNYDYLQFVFENAISCKIFLGYSSNVGGVSYSTNVGYIKYDICCLIDGVYTSMLRIYISGLEQPYQKYYYGNQNVIWLSQNNIDYDSYVEMLIDNSYNNGYGKGYQAGYDTGYNTGLTEAIDPTIVDPFFMVNQAVNNFLGTQLFGSISIGTILAIGFGIVLFGFAIKIFLGG